MSSMKNKSVIDTGMIGDNLSFASAEAYKRLRTNVLFSFADDSSCRVVGITSSLRGEGKSITSVNLAYSMAESGKRVLLIDADMRLPTVAKKLKMPSSSGLSNILAGVEGNDEIIRHVKFKKNDTQFDVITSGELPPNPAELLGSKRMTVLLDKLRNHYNYIFIDLPPVCAVADALTVSKFTDGMIIVVRQDYCRTDSLRETVSQLKFAEANLIGFVFNGAGSKNKKYGKYYKKYGYEYADPSSYN